MNATIILALSTALLWITPSMADDRLPIVEGSVSKATIIIPDNASPVLIETAQDMADIIRGMSDAALPVVRKSQWEPDGTAALVLDINRRDESLPDLAYHVWRDGRQVNFSGGDTMGIVNGVYAFLGIELGCRWYIPGPLGEYIPRRLSITIGRMDISDGPDFESVAGIGGYPDPVAGALWRRRNGLEGFPIQYHEHNWERIASPRESGEHPEWFAFYNGTRGDQLCTTNPDVIDSAVARAIRYFDESDSPMYSLSPNDNSRFCQCERCLALDHELGADTITSETAWMTPRLVYFCNQVAERVSRKYPDRFLSFYAYNTYSEPPATVRPHPNVLPVFVKTPWVYCANHAIDDPDCERNRECARILQKWSEISTKVYVYEYYGHWHWYGPYGLVHDIRHDLPWMRAHGVVGFNSETHPNWWTQGLNFYVAARMFWDLDLDVDTLVQEYYEHLYGPAATYVMAYGNAFEDLLDDVPYDRDEERSFIWDATPAFLDSVGALLNSAEAVLRSAEISKQEREVIGERLRKVRAGYRFTRAQAAVEAPSATPITVVLGGSESLLDLVASMESDTGLQDVIQLDLARDVLLKAARPTQAYLEAWNQTVMTPQRRSELLTALREGRTREFAAGIGCVTDWHLIGPFGVTHGEGIHAVAPPELGVDLDATYEGKYGPVRWTSYQTPDPFGVVDLREVFSPQSTADCIAYLYAEFQYNGHGSTGSYSRLRLGSNDGMTVWLNGELIYTTDVERTLTTEEDRLTVTLRGGTNRFLVKVYNAGGGFGHSMRLMHWDYRPMDFPVPSEAR